MKQKPEVKTGVNRGRRVYWVWCPLCGNSPNEHVAKVAARNELKAHKCDSYG